MHTEIFRNKITAYIYFKINQKKEKNVDTNKV